MNFINLIDRSANISKDIRFKNQNIFIGKNVTINLGSKIAENTIINTGSIIEHECIVDKNTNICPGVKIGGRTKIGSNCFLGIGSSIIDKVTIKNNVIIGAGSVVIKNINSNCTYAGSPAKKIK